MPRRLFAGNFMPAVWIGRFYRWSAFWEPDRRMRKLRSNALRHSQGRFRCGRT